jgi:ankyrin repeat protein
VTNIYIVCLLLNGGVDISAQQTSKQHLSNSPIEATALHWAVMWGSEKAIRLLLSRGADATAKANGDLRTGFQWARISKIPEIVKLFPGLQSDGSRIASHDLNPAFEHRPVDSKTNTRVCNKAPERTLGN